MQAVGRDKDNLIMILNSSKENNSSQFFGE